MTTSNAARWAKALFTRSTKINAAAAKIAANRSRFELVSKLTGVPWDVIGVIHYRESSNDFRGVLHNGQKIIGTGKKTTLVPAGRGPFATWEEAAIDALANCHPHLAKNKDWSIGTTLDKLEAYNGLGYRNKGLPSPFLWAGTDQYVKGKYVADGKFDPNHVDQQLGVAALLMKLREKPAPLPIDLPDDPEPAAPQKRKTLMDLLRGFFVRQATSHVVSTLKDQPKMTNMLTGVIRHIITIFGGGLLGTGLVGDDEITIIAGAIASLLGVVWSIIEKRARA
jgi:lysozyme family protein